jgi:ABC-type transporter Mla subunit MlaD
VSTEAKVGAFVLGSFAVLAFAIIRLLNAQLSGHVVPYRTYLQYAGGLEPGTQVLFGGINVGRVTAVRPAASDPTERKVSSKVGFHQRHEWCRTVCHNR